MLSQRKRLSTQLIWVPAAGSLIYIHSGFSMSHFKEEKNWGGKLEEERVKAVAFVHSLSGDTACSVERKLREIALLPFKHSEYILNIKTDFSSNIFLSPGKINVVWFGTLVILLVNASILFRYWQTSYVWMKGLKKKKREKERSGRRKQRTKKNKKNKCQVSLLMISGLLLQETALYIYMPQIIYF